MCKYSTEFEIFIQNFKWFAWISFTAAAIRPDEIESAKKHGSPLELLIPKSEEEEQCSVSEPVVTQTSVSYEETSVSHSESYSLERNAVSPTTSNK